MSAPAAVNPVKIIGEDFADHRTQGVGGETKGTAKAVLGFAGAEPRHPELGHP